MTWMRRIANLYELLFQRDKLETDLDAEVSGYFEVLVGRYIEQGMSKEAAQRTARLQFEGPEQVKEKVREARMGATIEATWKDVRYALRMLRRSPGFVAVAVCSLAIGIGATSAIYSIADGLLLRPLPVPKPDEVVAISPITGQPIAGLNMISYPDYVDFRDRNRTFDGLAAQAFSPFGFAPNRGALPRLKYGMFVSGNFFRVLGVEPVIGRGFRADEDQVTGRDAVAVLSHDLWMSEFDASPSAMGKKIWLNGVAFTVVGVAPESFTGTDQFLRPALYVPLAMSPALGNTNNLEQRQVRWLSVKGRLKPAVGIAQAQADIGALTNSLRQMYPETDGDLRMKVESQLQFQTDFSPPRTAFVVMLGLLALCVLLVACANVGGLLLSRSSVRAREIAVRLAIGAGRVSLVRQLLIENLLLAIVGGAAGLALPYAAVKAFNALPAPTDLPIKLSAQVDSRMLLFTACASILSTLLFGLIPALQSTIPDIVPALRASDSVNSKKSRFWGRSVLVAGQVALSLVLLVVSAVLVQGFRAELLRGPGFRIAGLFLTSLDTTMVRYTEAQSHQFYEQLLDKTRVAPAVKSAALASTVPIAFGASQLAVVPEGYQLKRDQQSIQVFDNVVSDGYFETLGIPIVQGRSFLESDRAMTTAMAIVNEQFARHYWPNQSVLGKRLRLRNSTGKLVEIVGVARTTKYLSITEAPLDFVYLPFSQNEQPQMTLIAASTSPDAAALSPVLRRIVQDLDRNIPVFDARRMQDLYDSRQVKAPAMIFQFVSALGIMGLILAVIGLYGLVAYSVSRRTREIGIRMAIGADRTTVARMVLKQGLLLGVAGVAVGLAIGVPMCRVIVSGTFLYFGQLSVLPFAAVSSLLILTTIGATYIPARRAAHIDPMRALKDE